ncbi:MAG: acetylxylan esterase, partial [Victivallales bacterium]|nr:acetylxylan esterase [Victivallales bacterium]
MPLIDMPLEELKNYQGLNPCPADFDEFWDRGLEEMRRIDPEIELIPADFPVSFAKCFNMFFTGVGGARVHAKLVRPENLSSPQPAVLQFHGYAVDCGDWQSKLAYAAQGYTVAALDCRGQ